MKILIFVVLFAVFASEYKSASEQIREKLSEIRRKYEKNQEDYKKSISKPSTYETLEAIVAQQTGKDKMSIKKLCTSFLQIICKFCGADAVTNVSFTCVRFKKFVLALYKNLEPVPLITGYLKPAPLVEGLKQRDGSKKFFAPARLFQVNESKYEFLPSPLLDPLKVCKIEHKRNASFFAFYVPSPYDFECKHDGNLRNWSNLRNPNSKVSNARLTHCLVGTEPDTIDQFTVTGCLNVKDQLKLMGAVGSQAIVRHEHKNPDAFFKQEFLLQGQANKVFEMTTACDAGLIYKDAILFFIRPRFFDVEIIPFMILNGVLKHYMFPGVRINFEGLNGDDLKIVPRPSVSVDEHNIIVSWKKGPNKFQSINPEDHLLVHSFSKDPTEWVDDAQFHGPFEEYDF